MLTFPPFAASTRMEAAARNSPPFAVNWDAGKWVTFAGITVTDRFLGEFHRQGLAHEYDCRGSFKRRPGRAAFSAPTRGSGTPATPSASAPARGYSLASVP